MFMTLTHYIQAITTTLMIAFAVIMSFNTYYVKKHAKWWWSNVVPFVAKHTDAYKTAARAIDYSQADYHIAHARAEHASQQAMKALKLMDLTAPPAPTPYSLFDPTWTMRNWESSKRVFELTSAFMDSEVAE